MKGDSLKLNIPNFSRCYVNTNDNKIYSKIHNRPLAEWINVGDHNHPVSQLSIINDNGERKLMKVHRLIYSAYHPNENMEGLQINHKDENSLNNSPENLELVTNKQNINYGTCRERISKSLKGKPNLALSKPVKARVIDTGEIEYYQSISDACRKLHITNSGIIRSCRNQKYKSKNRIWSYCTQ